MALGGSVVIGPAMARRPDDAGRRPATPAVGQPRPSRRGDERAAGDDAAGGAPPPRPRAAGVRRRRRRRRRTVRTVPAARVTLRLPVRRDQLPDVVDGGRLGGRAEGDRRGAAGDGGRRARRDRPRGGPAGRVRRATTSGAPAADAVVPVGSPGDRDAERDRVGRVRATRALGGQGRRVLPPGHRRGRQAPQARQRRARRRRRAVAADGAGRLRPDRDARCTGASVSGRVPAAGSRRYRRPVDAIGVLHALLQGQTGRRQGHAVTPTPGAPLTLPSCRVQCPSTACPVDDKRLAGLGSDAMPGPACLL